MIADWQKSPAIQSSTNPESLQHYVHFTISHNPIRHTNHIILYIQFQPHISYLTLHAYIFEWKTVRNIDKFMFMRNVWTWILKKIEINDGYYNFFFLLYSKFERKLKEKWREEIHLYMYLRKKHNLIYIKRLWNSFMDFMLKLYFVYDVWGTGWTLCQPVGWFSLNFFLT